MELNIVKHLDIKRNYHCEQKVCCRHFKCLFVNIGSNFTSKIQEPKYPCKKYQEKSNKFIFSEPCIRI